MAEVYHGQFGANKKLVRAVLAEGLGNASPSVFDIPCMFCQCLVGDREEGEVLSLQLSLPLKKTRQELPQGGKCRYKIKWEV